MHVTRFTGFAGLAVLAISAIGALTGCELEFEADDEPLEDGDEFVLDVAPSEGDQPNFADELESGYRGGFRHRCLGPEELPTVPPMTAWGGPGEITVQHDGIVTSIEPEWFVTGTIDFDDQTIEIVYEEQAVDPSPEQCIWRLDYVIQGVPPGTWTVEARYDESNPVEVTAIDGPPPPP